MLQPNTRRSGLRLNPRMSQSAMDVEENMIVSIGKERAQRNFGVNIANQIPQNTLLRASSKSLLPGSKANSRKTLRSQAQVQPRQSLPLQNHMKKSQTSLYHETISSHMGQAERTNQPQGDFLSWQPQLDAQMRTKLVGWLMDVCTQFRLKNETLFMTVSLIDRFLSRQMVARYEFQLLGIACLFIASKYQEIYPPHINKFVAVSVVYTKQQLLDMQSRIILKLNFNLISCTSLRFLDMKCHQATQLDQKTKTLAQYILSLCLLDYTASCLKSSCMGLSALCLSASVTQNRPMEPHHLGLQIDRYTPIDDLKSCFTHILALYNNRNNGAFQSVKLRYGKSPHFDKIIF